MFRNNLWIWLSPPFRKYEFINPFKRPGQYPRISKRNAKKCNNCCLYALRLLFHDLLGRTFSAINDSDLDDLLHYLRIRKP